MNELEVSALGREAYLGQLYDAKRGVLLSGFSLYKTADIGSPRKIVVSNTETKVVEVKSFSERANSLNISAQLSVTIMGGAISIGGGGSYLGSKQDTSESNTIAFVAKYRTASQSLDLSDLEGKTNMSADALAKTHATHVVTSITYGANFIGTLTQKSANREDSTDIKGNFSLEVFKGLGKAFGAEGKAELSVEEKEKLRSYELDVSLSADVKLGDEETPTDPVAMLALVKRSGSMVGEGVPCEVRLTPLTMLSSDMPSFRELAEADLIGIRDVYDNVLKLENSRSWLCDTVEARRELFPSFADHIRTRSIAVAELVQRARDKLRKYLEKYRGSSASSDGTNGRGDVSEPSEFVGAINGDFATEISNYEEDKEKWRRYEDRLSAAETHGFPAIGISAVSRKMQQASKGMLAAVLVPEDANWEALMNIYGNLAVDIKQWRTSIDKASKEGDDDSKTLATQYASIYADPLRDATLESFDDEAGTLKKALETARKTQRAVFLTYGRSRSHLGGFVWHVLNKEGWGIIVNKIENWRYIGDVHFGKPHGSGVMTYVNKTKYAGHFVYGQRDGIGSILDEDGNEVHGQSGVFVKNVLEPHGVLVEVTVINRDGAPVQFGKVALNKYGGMRQHVDRIGTVMEWDGRQRFRLSLDGSSKQVHVIGSMIDPDEDASVEFSSWPLDDAVPKITARTR